MDDSTEMFVDFRYCKSCENWDKKETDDPCWDCLTNPTNTNSIRPIYYKEKENKK